MAFISPVMFTSFAQMSVVHFATATTTLTTCAVKDFFLNLFLHPGDHSVAIIIMGGVAVAACVGLAFLIKMIYERCCLPPKHLKT
jgi:hypothetical protein